MLPPSWKSEVQKTIEETANADRQKREAEQNNAAAKVTAAINSLADAQKAQTSSEDSNEQKDRAINWVTLFLVFLTVIFTFLTWRTLSGQLREMKSAGEQTQKIIDTNAKLVEAATKQADATARAADAATKQSENSDKALIESQRAWVGPTTTKVDGAIEIGKPVTIVAEYLNSGRGPAINFVYATDTFVGTLDEDTNGITSRKIDAYYKGCRELKTLSGGQVVFPAIGGGFGNPNGQVLTTKLSGEIVDQEVIDGTKIIYLDGCFLYKSFNIVRHTYFCFFYRATFTKLPSLNICQNGTGAD
jgi:hypothetical protein